MDWGCISGSRVAADKTLKINISRCTSVNVDRMTCAGVAGLEFWGLKVLFTARELQKAGVLV